MIDFCLCGRLREGCTYHDPKLQPGYAVKGCVYDVSGVAYIQGVTNFTYETVCAAAQSFGLSSFIGIGGSSPVSRLSLVMHPALRLRLKKNDLLDIFHEIETFCGVWIDVSQDIELNRGVTFVKFEEDGKTLGLLKVREH